MIAFPKTGTGADPVFKSPSASPDAVLREYGLRASVNPKSSAGGLGSDGGKGEGEIESAIHDVSPPQRWNKAEESEDPLVKELGGLPSRFLKEQ